MAPDPTRTPDDEPTQVSPPVGEPADAPAPSAAEPTAATPTDPPKDVVTDAPLWPDPPRVEHTTPPTGGEPPIAGEPSTGADATGDVPPPADDPAGKDRGRRAADRAAGGAKVAADRVSQAASATAQALRETDVNEIARNTTKLIENTRPFFLAAFAIVFTFLAAVENHAAIGVVFAIAAVLCVLGAAFSPAVDHSLKRRD
ncbi:MAG: hypothetical protein WC558_02345 [Patulibacter sp.]